MCVRSSHLRRLITQKVTFLRVARNSIPLHYSVQSSHLQVQHHTMEKSWPKVILFGDSLTQFGYSQDGCWAALVGDLLQRKCDIVNRGFSGYNTRWCKIILPKLVTKNDVKDTQLFTIFLGANDSVDAKLCPKQHVPLEEYKQNMKDMIQYLVDLGLQKDRIVVISPPACVESKWEAECKAKGRQFGKFNGPTKTYASTSMDVARECGTLAVDLYSNMVKEENWENMLNDGLHLSTRGSVFLFDLLRPHLEKIGNALPLQQPNWDDIDNENPHAELDKY